MHADPSKRPVAVITGGGAGIGRATALMLAQRGWDLVLAGRRPDPLEKTAADCRQASPDCRAVAAPADVADPRKCKRLIDLTDEQFGRLDALINNAGGGPIGAARDASPEDIQASFAVNALAPAYLIHAAWPIFERQGGGRIINVSSMAATDPFPGLFAYGAGKAACESYVRSIVNERGNLALRAFAVAPGAVETNLLRSYFDESTVPTEACLSPEDVAEVIVGCALGEHDDRDGDVIHVQQQPSTTNQ